MDSDNRNILITILLFILILAVSYWYFFLTPQTKNNNIKTQQAEELTEQQKIDILSTTSSVPAKIVSDVERKSSLNRIDKSVKPVNSLSIEEKLKILNQTNFD